MPPPPTCCTSTLPAVGAGGQCEQRSQGNQVQHLEQSGALKEGIVGVETARWGSAGDRGEAEVGVQQWRKQQQDSCRLQGWVRAAQGLQQPAGSTQGGKPICSEILL